MWCDQSKYTQHCLRDAALRVDLSLSRAPSGQGAPPPWPRNTWRGSAGRATGRAGRTCTGGSPSHLELGPEFFQKGFVGLLEGTAYPCSVDLPSLGVGGSGGCARRAPGPTDAWPAKPPPMSTSPLPSPSAGVRVSSTACAARSPMWACVFADCDKFP